MKIVRECVAEFLGTFALVFFGAGSIVLTSHTVGSAAGANLITIALAHGLILIVFVTGAIHITGGQFNPAVSVGLVVAGKQPVHTAVIYIITQLLAAASGAGMLIALLGADVANSEVANLGATIGEFTKQGDITAVIGFEAIMTFALMWVVLSCIADNRAHKLGGVCIGLVVMACIFLAGPLTGASMNPARTFGPALYGHWDMHWVYWAAPMAGAIAAGALWRGVKMESTDKD